MLRSPLPNVQYPAIVEKPSTQQVISQQQVQQSVCDELSDIYDINSSSMQEYKSKELVDVQPQPSHRKENGPDVSHSITVESSIDDLSTTKKLLSRVDKKPSCTLTNVVSTCVNKASSHLELLQSLIEEWFGELPTAHCVGHGHSPSKGASARSQARFKTITPVSTSLAVDGRGMQTASQGKHSIASELPYLGGMEVIEEVFTLITRLERDVQNTQKNLMQEKLRARFLQKKMDALAVKRAVEFPLAVQAEHNAAVADLSELHWHVTYKLRAEEKLKDRVEHAETFNKRLLDDISFVKKHCPLVEEKLSLETQAMQKINEAQDETQKELELTLDRLAKTKIRNEEAHAKAAVERENMAKEVEDVKRELQLAVTELADARRLCNTYNHQTTETRTQISENVEEKQVLLVKVDNAKMTEQMQNKKIDELTNKIRMVEGEHHRLEEEAFNKQKELTIITSTMESEYSELKKACEHEEAALKKITQEVDDMLIEMDNLARKIAKCETGISEDEKVLRRMNNQIHNTEMMMNQMLDEFSKVQVFNSAIRDKLQEEKERISQIEDALRLTLETLRKQCKDEVHTRSVLHTRISSDGTELVKSQSEAKYKKQKLAKTVVEIEEQLKVVVEKVDKLRDVFKAKREQLRILLSVPDEFHAILEGLQEEIKETQEAKEKAQKEFVQTKEELNPYLQQLKPAISLLNIQDPYSLQPPTAFTQSSPELSTQPPNISLSHFDISSSQTFVPESSISFPFYHPDTLQSHPPEAMLRSPKFNAIQTQIPGTDPQMFQSTAGSVSRSIEPQMWGEESQPKSFESPGGMPHLRENVSHARTTKFASKSPNSDQSQATSPSLELPMDSTSGQSRTFQSVSGAASQLPPSLTAAAPTQSPKQQLADNLAQSGVVGTPEQRSQLELADSQPLSLVAGMPSYSIQSPLVQMHPSNAKRHSPISLSSKSALTPSRAATASHFMTVPSGPYLTPLTYQSQQLSGIPQHVAPDDQPVAPENKPQYLDENSTNLKMERPPFFIASSTTSRGFPPSSRHPSLAGRKISTVVEQALSQLRTRDTPLPEYSNESVDLKQQLVKLTNQMEMMARKKDEMDHTAKILSRSIKQNEIAVEKLKKELEEANIQLEDQTNITNSLMSSRDDVVRRLETRNKEHQSLMTERTVTIQSHTKTLQTELGLNKGLAMRYRQLQGQHVDMKSRVMDMFDERNRLEAGIKDLKQLKGLQSRMHRALETYYKFRGMFNSGELERVQAENRISAKKLAHLQEHFTTAVGGITAFLNSQMKVLDKREVVQEYQVSKTKSQPSSMTNVVA